MDKGLVTVHETDQADEDDVEVGQVGLEWGLEGQSAVQVVVENSLSETEVCDTGAHPAKETGDGGDVGEPVENVSGGRGDVQVRKTRHNGTASDTCVWNTESVHSLEHFWSVAVLC